VGQVVFRLVFLHDLSYAIEMTMADGSHRLVKGFVREADAEAWIAAQKRLAPKDEIWIRRPMLNWHH
jgi:hypothetical protein